MKKIENTSLVCIDCYYYGKSVAALQKSMAQNEFDRVIFFTDIPLDIEGIEVIQIKTITSKKEYSFFCVKELWKHITTKYILNVQHDGWTTNGELFDERLYDYDWCGALWLENDGYANGNGGYSWKSKKLLDAIGQDDLIKATNPEDAQICRTYRDYLEKQYQLKWATDEICEGFAYELREPCKPTMGFHGNFYPPYHPTVILKRSAALGDCLILEPVMRYYAMKGYNIVLDIPKPFFELYTQHYFPVTHISMFNSKRIKPEKQINLDMSYESKPGQNYLKSYFEFCGIKDYKLSKPQLYPLVDDNTRLFKKYCVIHLDRREQEHRNVHGINWVAVQRYLENKGYLVIQVSRNEHEKCGIEINTPSIGFMKFVIAGASLFIGVDSAPSNIAVAYNIPSVIFFGSVNPDYIHPDLRNVEIIQGKCEKSGCWHIQGGTAGKECAYKGTDKYLQCCKTDSDVVVGAINKLIKNNADNN